LFSQIDDWHFSTNYTYLNATFMDALTALIRRTNSSRSCQQWRSNPRHSEHLYKATIGVDLWKKVSFGIDGIYSGDQFFRGDEANNNNKLSGYWCLIPQQNIK